MSFKKGIFLFFLFSLQNVYARDTIYLHLDSFLQHVILQHPVSQMAGLKNVAASAYLLKEKGNFDPYLKGDLLRKEFDGKSYYDLANGGLKIPLWPGFDLKAGIENNTGQFLNSENTVPAGGLIQTGVELPLIQGWVTDARRTAVKKARLGIELGEMERLQLLNILLAEAGQLYWQWAQAYREAELYQNVLSIAQNRFDGVKQLYMLGDKPAIDTLEAFIQVQNRAAAAIDAKARFTSLGYYLRYYLWNEDSLAIWQHEYMPVINYPFAFTPTDAVLLNQPELTGLQIKRDQLALDMRLKREMLKPNIKLQYNFLNAPTKGYTFTPADYKFGASFSMPVLLRKERGELRLAKTYLLETELKQVQKRTEYFTKLSALTVEINNLIQQQTLHTSISENYFTLLMAEQTRFNAGESSLFVVNTREQFYVQASVKLLEVALKLRQSQIKYYQTSFTWPVLNLN